MVLPVIPQNLVPNDPDLSDVLQLHRKGIFLDLNCHHVGTVEEFDAERQVAKVTINYKRTYFRPNAMGVVMPELKDYPIIVDAPVIFPGGGGYSITFPVTSGDECLVLFNDRDIDAWFAGSSSSPNPTPRLHSFADAFILVGPRSLPNLIPAFDDDGLVIRDRAGLVKLKLQDTGIVSFETPTVQGFFGDSGKVNFTNVSGEMVALLYTMLNALSSATAGGYPLLLPPTFATALSSFQTFKS